MIALNIFCLFSSSLCSSLFPSKHKNRRKKGINYFFHLNIHSFFRTDNFKCSLTIGCNVLCLSLCVYIHLYCCEWQGGLQGKQRAAVQWNQRNTYSEMAWSDVMKMLECKYELFSWRHPEKWCSFPRPFSWVICINLWPLWIATSPLPGTHLFEMLINSMKGIAFFERFPLIDDRICSHYSFLWFSKSVVFPPFLHQEDGRLFQHLLQ